MPDEPAHSSETPERRTPPVTPPGDPPAPQYRWINNRNLTDADLVGIGTAEAMSVPFAIWKTGCEGG